jgi:DNA modification methylase
MENRNQKIYPEMREVTSEEYFTFLKENEFVIVENQKVKFFKEWKINKWGPEKEYKLESTTVWSFPNRGDWATHRGDYPGNFSPFIPRNLIEKYTNKGDWVLDQMVGGGTTLVECKLLQRNGIGIDINPDAIMVTKNRLDFHYEPVNVDYKEPIIKTYVGDARNLDKIKDESIDLIVTHPPYASIKRYTRGKVKGDISQLSFPDYLQAMKEIAEESLRVLKQDKYCAILIGDTRKQRHFIPIAYKVMEKFLEVGFVLKEDIIKLQHHVSTSRGRWSKPYYDFYKIMHEHLFVFRKPKKGEKVPKLSSNLIKLM